MHHRCLSIERLEPRRLLSAAPGILLATPDGAEGETPDIEVAIRLATTDELGSPIDSIGIGETAFLRVSAEDVRPVTDLSGVFAVYLDVSYEHQLIAPRISRGLPLGFDIQFSDEYPNGKSGNAKTPGLLDEIGAFQAGYAPLGPEPRTILQVPFRATAIVPVDDVLSNIIEDSSDAVLDILANDQIQTGVVTFAGRTADIRPEHAILLFSPPEFLADAVIDFSDAQLRVTSAGHDVITAVSQPAKGGYVRISEDGNRLLYTPAKDFFGEETFSYTVVSGKVARVTVHVQPANDPPTASDDAYIVQHNQPLNISAAMGVLANDTDIDGDTLTVSQFTQPDHGALNLVADGSLQYIPDPDYRGTDTFSYTATDGQVESQPALVNLEVGPPQIEIRLQATDPNGTAVDYFTAGSPLQLQAWVRDLRDTTYPARGVAAAYLDVAYDPDAVSPLLDDAWPLGFQIAFGPRFQDPGHGTADVPGLIDEVGSYQPMGDPTGSDSQLLFEIPLDLAGLRAADDDFEVNYQSRSNSLDLLANDRLLTWSVAFEAQAADVSPDSDIAFVLPSGPVSPDDVRYASTTIEIRNRQDLTIIAVEAPNQGGTASISADGQRVIYVPAHGYQGDETFAYTLIDGGGNRASANITLHVLPSWYNLRNPYDVNDDSHVSPIDALIVINDLNQNHSRLLLDPPNGAPFLDVDNDGYVRPLDALLVINELNRNSSGEAEGEPLDSTPTGSIRPVAGRGLAWQLIRPLGRGDSSASLREQTNPAAIGSDRAVRPASHGDVRLLAPLAERSTQTQDWLQVKSAHGYRAAQDLLEEILDLLATT